MPFGEFFIISAIVLAFAVIAFILVKGVRILLKLQKDVDELKKASDRR